MQLIGFNFTKIGAEKKEVLGDKPTINTNIEFTDVAKDAVDLLKDLEAVRVSFKFSIAYNANGKKDTLGSILFEGNIVLSAPPEKVKEIVKAWKKKEFAPDFKIPLFNLILRRCSAKALDLEEQTGLPPHLPLPQFKAQPPSEK